MIGPAGNACLNGTELTVTTRNLKFPALLSGPDTRTYFEEGSGSPNWFPKNVSGMLSIAGAQLGTEPFATTTRGTTLEPHMTQAMWANTSRLGADLVYERGLYNV